MFITIYGVNNIGKTYHAKRLTERLKKLGKRAIYIKYPMYKQKPTGPFLNNILRAHKKQHMNEEELQLWFVLNRYQFQPHLKKMLSQNTIVVAEDYVGTGIAWGMAKSRQFKTIQRQLELMNKFLVQPDCAILLEGRRMQSSTEARHIHEQNVPLLRRCQKIYSVLAHRYGWKIVHVDIDKDITAARVWRAVNKNLADYF